MFAFKFLASISIEIASISVEITSVWIGNPWDFHKRYYHWTADQLITQLISWLPELSELIVRALAADFLKYLIGLNSLQMTFYCEYHVCWMIFSHMKTIFNLSGLIFQGHSIHETELSFSDKILRQNSSQPKSGQALISSMGIQSRTVILIYPFQSQAIG